MAETTDPFLALTQSQTWRDSFTNVTPEVITYTFMNISLPPSYVIPGEHVRDGIREAFARWSAVSGLSFVEVTDTGAFGAGLIEIGFTYLGGGSGFSSYPSSAGSTIDFDVSLIGQDWSPGSYAFGVAVHEIGHVHGLKHPFEGTWTLPAALDHVGNTVMSYTGDIATATGPAPFDIAAVQSLYGIDATEWSDGIDWTFDAAAQRFAFTGGASGDQFVATAAPDHVQGLGGADTINGHRGDDSLIGGEGHDRLNGDRGGDHLYGGTGNDTVEGDGGIFSSLGTPRYDDHLFGEAGEDSLAGGLGNDNLSGGAGNDRLNGGAGTDTAHVSGDFARHTFTLSGGVLRLTDTLPGGDGADTLSDIEYVAFADGTRLVSDFSAALLGIAGTPSLAEGQSGTTAFSFTVTRSGNVGSGASATWVVSGVGANPADGADFNGGAMPSGTVSFFANETSKSITVRVAGDTALEPNEQFSVTLFDPTPGARITTATATGTIVADEPLLSIAATQADRAEGQSGSTPFTFTITRTGSTDAAAAANWQVAGSGADPANGTDFVGGSLPGGTVSFAPGETSRAITVSVAGDRDSERDEGFTVTLSALSGAYPGTTAATATIRSDEPTLSIATTPPGAFEGQSVNTPFVVTILRGGNTSEAAGVTWTYLAGTTNATDFVPGQPTSGTLAFGIGEVAKSITFHLVGDQATEADEAFEVLLSAPSGAALGVHRASFGLWNDDGDASGNALSGGAGGDWREGLGGPDLLDLDGRAPTPEQGGNDTGFGGEGNDTLFGGAGTDVLLGEAGVDVIVGGVGGDWIEGGAAGDWMELDTLGLATPGNDTGLGGEGNDTIFAGAGQDVPVGQAGDDVLYAGDGGDWIEGLDGNDWIEADDGWDTLAAGGWDTVLGGAGNDLMKGHGANDILLAGDGRDTVLGGPGSDWLEGHGGNDWMEGEDAWDGRFNDGWDTLKGGHGNDMMIGGTGADAFIIEGWDMRPGDRDEIGDFNPWEGDRVWLPGAGVTLRDGPGGGYTHVTTYWGYELIIWGPSPADARWGIGLT